MSRLISDITFAVFDGEKDISWMFAIITLTYSINPLIFPSTIVRLNANNIKIINNPTSRNAGISSNHWLVHLLHVSEPSTALSPGGHCPHAIPPLLKLH